MAASVNAFYYVKPDPGSMGSMIPETPPALLWGQGDPAAISVFKVPNKGSIYMKVNETDDESACWMKVDEGEDAADWVRFVVTPFNVANTYVDTALKAFSIVNTATNISGAEMISLDVRQTIAGSAGSWNTAAFFQITESATKHVSGYFCAAEFEVVNDCKTASTWGVLVLNSISKYFAGPSAYIILRDYGSTACLAFASFIDIADATTVAAGKILSGLSGGKETTCNVALRCSFGVGGTPFWLLGTTTAPA